MTDKVVNAVYKTRKELWNSFKQAISIKGYHYYQPPPEVKYRYPAPGSCAFDQEDHFHMYKNDWKEPFRTSEYNISRKEK